MASVPFEEKSGRMAEALKKGWKMLSETCPRCGSPLFRTDGETLCVVCGERVILVKSDEEVAEEVARLRLMEVREILISKVEEIAGEIPTTEGYDELSSKVLLVNEVLDAIGKLNLLINKKKG